MKAMFGFVFAVILLSVVSSMGNAQAWTVITSAHDTLRSCIVGRLECNVINLIRDSSMIQISADSVSLLTRHGRSHFWTGAGYGLLAGVVVGVCVGAATYQKPTGGTFIDLGPDAAALGGAILGGVTGFTIGGIVGAAAGGDERYDLTQEPGKEKLKILRELGKEGPGLPKALVEQSTGEMDILYLDDGSVAQGTIIGEVGSDGYLERVTIRTADGQTKTYEASTITRVERGR